MNLDWVMSEQWVPRRLYELIDTYVWLCKREQSRCIHAMAAGLRYLHMSSKHRRFWHMYRVGWLPCFVLDDKRGVTCRRWIAEPFIEEPLQ